MATQNDGVMDPDNLFREENFTDQKMGAIRKLIPVKADGSEDGERKVMFFLDLRRL